ncbi:IclR family transcriptional regulator C-terminal domain-containing protein [Kutzneria viridogrisea]|uniref:DNA-binding IclR family transcriptional regulator n=1 Tax=Kutzneria viridogrisea TaxID=47990 RepID=A0ABR6BKV5_9PSEU|nr:DNA-binding IclR family transcriptional regulator [Kutzneria viridogrisea]
MQSERPPSGLIGSVQRALRVLEVVAEAGDGVTAKAVARRTGFKLSTTYHLLNTLVYEGYLVRLGNARGFGLGYQLPRLSNRLISELSITPGISQTLRELHARARAAMYYAVIRDDELVVAEVADSEQHRRAQPLDLGFHESAHATSFGKVLLAAMSPAARRRYLSGAGLPRLTERTITRLPDLDDELADIRQTGIAKEVEEFQPGLACLSVPVRNAGGRVVGALALSTPTSDFDARRRLLESIIKRGGEELSRILP